jgi:hypothetical protein
VFLPPAAAEIFLSRHQKQSATNSKEFDILKVGGRFYELNLRHVEVDLIKIEN